MEDGRKEELRSEIELLEGAVLAFVWFLPFESTSVRTCTFKCSNRTAFLSDVGRENKLLRDLISLVGRGCPRMWSHTAFSFSLTAARFSPPPHRPHPQSLALYVYSSIERREGVPIVSLQHSFGSIGLPGSTARKVALLAFIIIDADLNSTTHTSHKNLTIIYVPC